MMGTIVYNSLHSALRPLEEINTFYPEGLAFKPSSVIVDIDAVKLTVWLRPSCWDTGAETLAFLHVLAVATG